MGAELLYDIANDLLDIGDKILRDGHRDPVVRKFVNMGQPLAPVEFGPGVSQLCVTVGPVQPDLITDVLQRREGKIAGQMLLKARFEILLLRASKTTGDGVRGLPSIDQLNAEAKEHYADGWQLVRGYAWHWAKRQLVPSYTFTYENMQWIAPGLQTYGPSGGLRGWRLPFTVSVHDVYVEEELSV